MVKEAEIAAAYIQHHFNLNMPKIAVVLGSGLGGFTQSVKVITSLQYSAIPGFPHGQVEGHKGCLSLIELEHAKQILVMEGRFHFYEGYTPQQVTLPIVVFHLLGIKTLILSNAAGALNPNFQAGDLMLINDHINLTGNHPLIGKNDVSYGPRFLDQTTPYDPSLIQKAKTIATKLKIRFQEGVYIALSGPTYETKSEVNMCQVLGADAVGMSTVYEVMVANYFGIKVLGISSLTNMATGLTSIKHDHAQVVEIANQMTTSFSNWVKEIIASIKQ